MREQPAPAPPNHCGKLLVVGGHARGGCGRSPNCKLTRRCTPSALVGHTRSHASEARFSPPAGKPTYRANLTDLGTPPRPWTFDSRQGVLEVTAMRAKSLRIVILAAIWLAAIWAHLAGALATAAFANPAPLLTTAPPAAASGTSLLRSPRAASYRPDALDTGPPTPGPTDPNGPSS